MAVPLLRLAALVREEPGVSRRRWCILLAVLAGDMVALMLPMSLPPWIVVAVMVGSWQLGCAAGALLTRTRRVSP